MKGLASLLIDWLVSGPIRIFVKMMARYRTILLAAAFVLGAVSSSAAAGEAKTVVELFTSQGCSSCPPADAYLSELAARDDVIALSFHVDYWNYIGWRDPFSNAAWTARQRAYGRTLGRRYVYTPQIVIDGRTESIGSKRSQIAKLIAAAKGREKLAIEVRHPDHETVSVRIPGARGYDGPPATVWMAFYDRQHTTSIAAGENRGVKLTNANVVRVFKSVGVWRGEPVVLTLPLVGAEGRDGCAVLVQAGRGGHILGAATIPLPGKGG